MTRKQFTTINFKAAFVRLSPPENEVGGQKRGVSRIMGLCQKKEGTGSRLPSLQIVAGRKGGEISISPTHINPHPQLISVNRSFYS
jgi:hypothetical protein